MKKPNILPFERLLTFEESNTLKVCVLKAIEVFESWGYDYLKIPAFERYEVQEKALGERAKEAIVLKDVEGGELISLRADFTAQVVRSVSFFKVWHFPLRVYYFGTLFRTGKRTCESFHAGIELLGVGDVEGDAEVIASLSDYLRKIGLKDTVVSIGHVSIVGKILSRVEEEGRDQIREAFREKNLTLLRKTFGDGYESRLPLMQGKEEALSLLSELDLEEERRELEKLGELLTQAGVDFIYDLSEVREFPYYTGVVFEFFHPSLGSPIAGGGRYNALPELYDASFPATGGTVYLDTLLPLLEHRREEKDFFVIDLSDEKRFGFKIASTLRAKGYRVGRDIVKRSLGHSLDHAFSQGYRRAVVIRDERDVRVYTTVKDYTLHTLKEFLELF